MERIDAKYIWASGVGQDTEKCGLEWRWELSSSRQEAGMRLSVVREKGGAKGWKKKESPGSSQLTQPRRKAKGMDDLQGYNKKQLRNRAWQGGDMLEEGHRGGPGLCPRSWTTWISRGAVTGGDGVQTAGVTSFFSVSGQPATMYWLGRTCLWMESKRDQVRKLPPSPTPSSRCRQQGCWSPVDWFYYFYMDVVVTSCQHNLHP